MHDRSTERLRQISRRSLVGAGIALAATRVRTNHALGHATPGPPATPGAASCGKHLVDTAWLAARLDEPAVVPVGFMPADEFESAHIPGSVQIDWPDLEVIDTSDESLERWRTEIGATLGDLGITPDNTVVAYDNGSLFAARLWWVLRYLGHCDVRVLDGGLPSWNEAGEAVETGPASTAPPAAGSLWNEPNHSMIARYEEVLGWRDAPDVILVDARTEDEYTDGHIPGAININYPTNAQPDPPRFWKPADALRNMYSAADVTEDKLIVPYCSSGVRSAVTAFTLDLLGYERVTLYTGSWQEWTSRPDAPITQGNHP